MSFGPLYSHSSVFVAAVVQLVTFYGTSVPLITAFRMTVFGKATSYSILLGQVIGTRISPRLKEITDLAHTVESLMIISISCRFIWISAPMPMNSL